MAATQWPLETVEQITNSFSYDPFAPWKERKGVRETLYACTLVSRRFYSAARRELWRNLCFSYFPNFPNSLQNHCLERLHRALVDNPALRHHVKTVGLDLVPDDPNEFGDHEDDESEAPTVDLTQRPSFIGLCKVLTLLASAKVERLYLTSELRIAGSDTGVDMRDLNNELLFSLAALRCTPSLKECHLALLNKPPPSVTFGDPATDAVQKMSVTRGKWETTGAAYKDITVPRGSPCLDISDEAYARTINAIQNTTLPLPLLPSVTHLILEPLNPFWDVLQSHPKVPGSADGWNGHLPRVQYFFPNGAIAGTEEAYLAIHTKPTIQRIRVLNRMGCESLGNFENLPNLRQLDVLLDMNHVGLSRHLRLEELLRAVALMLEGIPASQPLGGLNIECAFLTYTPEECQSLLRSHQVWPILDDALLRLASRRKKRPLVVNVSFKLVFGWMFSTWRDEPSKAAGLRKVVEMVSIVLPNATRTSNIELKIDSDMFDVGEYPDHVIHAISNIS